MKKGIVAVLSIAAGVVLGVCGAGYLYRKENMLQRAKVSKFKGYYNMLNQWLILRNENKNISEYFIKNDYKTIAVYGVGEMGSRLMEELLSGGQVAIKYAIDKQSGGTYQSIDVLDLADDLEEVDVVVVTATFAFDEISEALMEKVSCPVISLEDVIYEL